MTTFLLFASVALAWFTVDSSGLADCNYSQCTLQQDWQDNLTCYYIEEMGDLYCSWLLLPTTSASIVYTVVLKWNSHLYCEETAPPFVRGNVNPDSRVTVWVSASYSHDSCMLTKNVSLTPNKRKKCPSPSNIKGYQLSNKLTVMWDSSKDLLQHQLQYREDMQAASGWIMVPVETGAFNATISSLNTSLSYVVRLRCIPNNERCSVCVWGREIGIPHNLTEKPTILEHKVEEMSQGKINIFLKWKTTQSRNVIGYSVIIERIPSYCNYMKTSFNLTENWVYLNLSMAYYRINISAYNEAGKSPSVTYTVLDFNGTALPTQINVLNWENGTIISWMLQSNPKCLVIDWGTGIEDMKMKVIRGFRKNFTLDDLQPYQLYKVILHAFDECQCEDLVKHERTLAMTYFYAKEGVPKTGPANVTIPMVTKHSAIVKWTEIPAEDCLGFLQGYRLHYTEVLKNLSLAVTVSSSTHQHLLTELTKNTRYRVQISGVTSKGEGVPSQPQDFVTLKYDEGEFEGVVAGLCLGIILTMAAAVTLYFLMLKRTRKQCWPEVPNPRLSSAIQNMENITGMAHLGIGLHPLLHLQPSNGAIEMCVVENYSKMLLTQGFLSEETLTGGISTDHPDPAAAEKADATLNPLKSLIKGSTTEKAKVSFHSDYASIEVSHTAMQALNKSTHHKRSPPPAGVD